jgi:acrylyl-CoA reductase (NADPH)
MLSRVTKQLKYRCAAAAVGNAGGVDVPLSIIPFLLRGVSLLGIDSVLQPFEARQKAWARLVRDLDLGLLDTMVVPARLAEVPELGAAILKGRIRGRVVVDVNA